MAICRVVWKVGSWHGASRIPTPHDSCYQTGTPKHFNIIDCSVTTIRAQIQSTMAGSSTVNIAAFCFKSKEW